MISVEYSKMQKCFHIDDLDYVMKLNLKRALNPKDTFNDWTIIGIFETEEEASKFADEIKNKIYDNVQQC